MTLKRRDPQALMMFKQLVEYCQKNPGGAALNIRLAPKEEIVVNHQGAVTFR
jgi:hypothetical protein